MMRFVLVAVVVSVFVSGGSVAAQSRSVRSPAVELSEWDTPTLLRLRDLLEAEIARRGASGDLAALRDRLQPGATPPRTSRAPTVQNPAGSIAIGLGLLNDVGTGECPDDDCAALEKSVSGEGAFFVTDNVAAVFGIGLGFRSLNTSYLGVAIDVDATVTTVRGGVRAYGPTGTARPFADVMVGYINAKATATAVGLRESASASGVVFSPGAGVDIATGDRAAIRVSGGASIRVIEGDTVTSFGAGVGIVFGVGSR